MAGCARRSSPPARKRRRLFEDATPLRLDGSEFFRGLQDARHNFCDVSVRGADDPTQSESQWIPCHRIVLMAHSLWFRRMLLAPMKEAKQDTIQLHNVPHDILQQLVDYMYSCEISVDASNALLLLQAADMLELGQIVETCQTFLREHIDVTNCLTIYRGAQQLSCADLTKECHDFLLEHFPSFCHSMEFLELDAVEISKLIASDELNVEKEEQVVAAVVRWLDHSFEERQSHAAELAGLIRLDLLAANHASLPDTPAGNHFQQAILSISAPHSTSTLRSSYGREPVIISLRCSTQGFGNRRRLVAVLHCLAPLTSNNWSLPCEPPQSRWHGFPVYVVKNGRLLVYVLTEAGSDECRHLHVYDATANQWTDLAVLPVRDHMKHIASPVVVRDQVYVVTADRVYAYEEGFSR
ncbi:kelch-like protein 5 [Paramacrobiotus metropolitanus]|uniref:kelch-like protein 5 n=1 Tax=Paramacrobiotus metropolitanus TaxID=2943436 RepID=UPI00244622C3|nr:kelch-like protein 5 [Paramacrobiotus metropolitanus]